MGKDKKLEQKKKINKKKLKNIDKYVPEEGNQMERLIKITVGVLAVLLVFYLVFAIYHGELFKNNPKEQESVQSIIITAGTAYSQEDSEYYVLFYDFNGDNKTYGDAFYGIFTNNNSSKKIYKVNLGSGLNSNHLAKEAKEVNTSNNSSLKVLDMTLIKVKNAKAVEVYSGLEKVKAAEAKLLKQES